MTATGKRLVGKARFNAAVTRLTDQKMARLRQRWHFANEGEMWAIRNRAILPSVAVEFGHRLAARLVDRR